MANELSDKDWQVCKNQGTVASAKTGMSSGLLTEKEKSGRDLNELKILSLRIFHDL